MITIDTAIEEVVAQGIATYSELMSRCRKHDLVKKRWKTWQILIDKGFTQSAISRRFKVNHSSVYHGLKEQKRIEAVKQMMSKIIKI